MKKVLSCDWGTTSFRLRLIETETLTIIEEETAAEGIAETFQKWLQSGQTEDKRQAFYLSIISKYIDAIQKKSGISLNDLPLIISGMASSTIGIINLAYKSLPCLANGEDLEVFTIEKSESFQHNTIIISGVRTENDVLRGEETKLIGCASDLPDSNHHLFIFPGTHPKHIEVVNGYATAFKTYMTGEFFDLLSNKSILSVSVKKSDSFEIESNKQSFSRGVNDSRNSNLLHSCFLVRTNDLFKRNSAEENYFYLSGLLIGSELNDLTNKIQNITIVGNAVLNAQYTTAIRILNIAEKGALTQSADADKALIKGQIIIYEQLAKKAEKSLDFG